MMYQVEVVGFGFAIREPYAVEQAHNLLVKCVEKMMQAFNEDERVRPYLIPTSAF
jgi:hypothetical protein